MMTARRHALVLIICVLPHTSATWADELGRLFTTPEQRTRLERQRQLTGRNPPSVATSRVTPLTVNGVVTRSDGSTTIWLNGQPQYGQSIDTGVTATATPHHPDRVNVNSDGGTTTTLKVGETARLNSGERHDLLGRGSIAVDKRR